MILSKDIIKEWGLSEMPESKKAEMVDRIGRILYQAILVRSLEILSNDEEEELDSLLNKDNTSPQDVLLFLKSKIPTFEKLVLEERKNLKDDLVMMAN
jgi:hypothetical protein